ncbi:MAG: hypothetical protein ACTSU4_07385 [Promethearchaeota archaeon]
MLFQVSSTVITILAIIIAIVILTLVIYAIVTVLESKAKAHDKRLMIFLLAVITVLLLPIILAAIGLILGAIGNLFAGIRNLIDGGGVNFVVRLVPILGFLILLVFTKYLIDLPWDSATWISLLLLFIMYILFSIVPETYTILGFGL